VEVDRERQAERLLRAAIATNEDAAVSELRLALTPSLQPEELGGCVNDVWAS
jgi:hypothetical protein